MNDHSGSKADLQAKIVALKRKIRDLEHSETERQKADEARRGNEGKFRHIFKYSVEGVFQTTPDGRYRGLNQASADIFGYRTPSDMISNIIDIANQHYVNPRERRDFIRRIEGAGEIRNFEVRCFRKDGEIIWVSVNARAVRNRDGKVLYYEGFFEDITQRKRMEEALRESERRLADIIDFLPDAIFVIDLEGRVIAWNRAIEEMTAVMASSMLGRGSYEYAVPFYGQRRPLLIDLILKKNAKIERGYESLIHQDRLLIGTTQVPRLKGKAVYLWGKAAPLYNSSGGLAGAIESIRDVDDHKMANFALQKREAELEIKTGELEDLNAALRVLLKQREKDQKELEDRIASNIKSLVLPRIERLRKLLPAGRVPSEIALLEASLTEIASPFVQSLSANLMDLTNREIEIATLVREGKVTKEIASFLRISESAVNMHRYRIRRKLHLAKDQNFRAYLRSLK